MQNPDDYPEFIGLNELSALTEAQKRQFIEDKREHQEAVAQRHLAQTSFTNRP